jgi:hypothetical protein
VCFRRLHGLTDYQTHVADKPGKYVVLSVTFGGGAAETVRVNVEAGNASCRRSAGPAPRNHPPLTPPFGLLPQSAALPFDCLATWGENFAVVRDAIGPTPLGSIPLGSGDSTRILGALQAQAPAILEIDDRLATLPVETALYGAYHSQAKTAGQLLAAGGLTPAGVTLLGSVTEALATYARVPELALPFRQAGDGGEPSPRGAQLRHFFQHAGANPLGFATPLDFVDYEARPLRINKLAWAQSSHGDIRRDAVDLLLRYESRPAVTEAKMKGDKWPSAGLQQILYYGTMLAHEAQMRRLERYYPVRFPHKELWLGLIVERHEEAAWRADLDMTLAFARHPAAQAAAAGHFAGLLVVEVEERPAGSGRWVAVAEHPIQWRRQEETV